MPAFDLELTDPAPAAVEKAMADAVEAANLRCRVGLLKADPAQYRRFVGEEFASLPEGVALWLSDKGRVEEYPPTPRGTLLGVAWRTLPTGRRVIRIAGRRVEPFKENPSNRFGPPWRSWPALCHLDPDHVVTRELAGGKAETVAICGCGAVGPPEKLGWMAGRCGPCHDHFEEYGQPLPGTKPVALRTGEQLVGVGFLLSGEAVAAVGTMGWREAYTVAVWDRLTGACHAGGPTYYSRKAVPRTSAAGGLGLWCEHGIVWVKGKGKGAALAISNRPHSAAFAFDGPRVVALGYNGEAWRRDLTEESGWQSCWPERRGSSDGIYSAIALSPGAKKAALGLSRCGVELLDWPNGGEAVELPALQVKDPEVMRVYSLAFSPDGKLLAAGIGRSGFVTDPSQEWIGRAGGVALYDLGSNKLVAKVLTPKDDIMAVAFSPDGALLFWGSTDCTVRVLDVATKKEVAVLSGHVGGVNALAFSPDGHTLASAGGDGLVRLWPWREVLARPGASTAGGKRRVAVGRRRAR